jgi:hypothetical protein
MFYQSACIECKISLYLNIFVAVSLLKILYMNTDVSFVRGGVINRVVTDPFFHRNSKNLSKIGNG